MAVDVAMYIPSLFGDFTGGAEIVLLNLGKGFARRGLYVDVVVIDPAGPEALLADVSSEIRVVHLKSGRRSYGSFPALVSYLRRERPVSLITFSFGTNTLAVLGRILTSVPYRTVLQITSNLSRNLTERPFKYGALELAFMRYLYPLAHKIVCVSQGVSDDLIDVLNLSSQLVQVIYNPLPPDIQEKAAQPVDHTWFCNDQIPVILSVGRLETVKDYPTLLKAFSLVLKRRSARLLILGEGSERMTLERLVIEMGLVDNVDLPGFVTNPFAYMSKASLLALSSIYEGMSNVIIEAMACGCPVVSTDCKSGPRELLDNGEYGMLTRVGDPEALAQAILDTLDHPMDSVKLRKRAEDFSFDKIVDEYLDVLNLSNK